MTWSASGGTIDAGWGLRVTPVVKAQSGAPYGRVVSLAERTPRSSYQW